MGNQRLLKCLAAETETILIHETEHWPTRQLLATPGQIDKDIQVIWQKVQVMTFTNTILQQIQNNFDFESVFSDWCVVIQFIRIALAHLE